MNPLIDAVSRYRELHAVHAFLGMLNKHAKAAVLGALMLPYESDETTARNVHDALTRAMAATPARVATPVTPTTSATAEESDDDAPAPAQKRRAVAAPGPSVARPVPVPVTVPAPAPAPAATPAPADPAVEPPVITLTLLGITLPSVAASAECPNSHSLCTVSLENGAKTKSLTLNNNACSGKIALHPTGAPPGHLGKGKTTFVHVPNRGAETFDWVVLRGVQIDFLQNVSAVMGPSFARARIMTDIFSTATVVTGGGDTCYVLAPDAPVTGATVWVRVYVEKLATLKIRPYVFPKRGSPLVAPEYQPFVAGAYERANDAMDWLDIEALQENTPAFSVDKDTLRAFASSNASVHIDMLPVHKVLDATMKALAESREEFALWVHRAELCAGIKPPAAAIASDQIIVTPHGPVVTAAAHFAGKTGLTRMALRFYAQDKQLITALPGAVYMICPGTIHAPTCIDIDDDDATDVDVPIGDDNVDSQDLEESDASDAESVGI